MEEVLLTLFCVVFGVMSGHLESLSARKAYVEKGVSFNDQLSMVIAYIIAYIPHIPI